MPACSVLQIADQCVTCARRRAAVQRHGRRDEVRASAFLHHELRHRQLCRRQTGHGGSGHALVVDAHVPNRAIEEAIGHTRGGQRGSEGRRREGLVVDRRAAGARADLVGLGVVDVRVDIQRHGGGVKGQDGDVPVVVQHSGAHERVVVAGTPALGVSTDNVAAGAVAAHPDEVVDVFVGALTGRAVPGALVATLSEQRHALDAKARLRGVDVGRVGDGGHACTITAEVDHERERTGRVGLRALRPAHPECGGRGSEDSMLRAGRAVTPNSVEVQVRGNIRVDVDKVRDVLDLHLGNGGLLLSRDPGVTHGLRDEEREVPRRHHLVDGEALDVCSQPGGMWSDGSATGLVVPDAFNAAAELKVDLALGDRTVALHRHPRDSIARALQGEGSRWVVTQVWIAAPHRWCGQRER